jgi:type IV pilus assembly protein PilY1
MIKNSLGQLAGLAAILILSNSAYAQLVVQENFNGSTLSSSSNTWLTLNGACLTASTSNTTFSTSSPVPGVIPGCVTSSGGGNSYYSGLGSTLVGGANGGALPDANSYGVLRLTNGASSSMSSTNGNNETGAIILANSFPSNEGVNITFNTFTWGGNGYSNGSGVKSGADGISFFLLDASKYPSTGSGTSAIYTVSKTGAYGGSLGYDCSVGKYSSSTGSGGDGIIGAYLGLGIDEYGNFVNSGDNGYPSDPLSPGALPNTIGIRGAGNVNSTTFPLDSNGNPTGVNPAASGFTGAVYTAQGVCQHGYYTAPATSAPVVTNVTGATSTPGSSATTNATNVTVVNISNTSTTTTGSGSHTTTTYNYTSTTTVYPIVSVYDYPLIKYKNISPTTVGYIFNQESVAAPQRLPTTGVANSGAIPINYNINLTSTGLLTVSYSYNGGTLTPIISNQSILASNGPLPTNFLFGFASGTGGGSNNHEIVCFKAVQIQSASSSAGGNIPQNTHVIEGNQIYLASYNPLYWTGTVTASELNVNSSTGQVTIATPSIWDAGCVLSGSSSCTLIGGTAVTKQQYRAMAAWNDGIAAGGTTVSGTAGGVALTVGNFSALSGNEQQMLNCGNPSTSATTCDGLGSMRVGFLVDGNTGSGDTVPTNTFRFRYSLLGDIIDSSPTWVGAPVAPFANTWVDKINSTQHPTEGTSYATFQTTIAALNSGQGRLNTVYVGANDGFVHGFAAGYGDVTSSTSADNTGVEVMAFAPSLPLSTIHNLVYGTGELDFPGLLYAHNDYVDATPGEGDLFWGGASATNGWQTWLVGGLGGGGNINGVIGGSIDTSNGTILTATANNGIGEIYAINITNPITPGSLSSSSGTALAANVMGDWNTNTIVCNTSVGAALPCNTHMGSTYGTPVIRRLHSGNWGIIFGNGVSSASGTAGIFIIEVTGSGATPTYVIHYMDTGAGPSSDPTGKNTNNGIEFVYPVDLDGDHIADYVYAGDLLGNIWRFDITSTSAGSWGANPVQIFQASSSTLLRPITTSVIVATIPYNGANGVVVDFVTGREIQQTLTSVAGYAGSGQTMGGVWDWNMSSWNSKSTTQYYTPPTGTTGIVPTLTNLTEQTLTSNTVTAEAGTASGYTISNNVVCYSFMTNCTGSTYGWYMGMQNTQEQFIYNPAIEDGNIYVNSVIPPDQQVQATSCTTSTATGYTYGVNAASGTFNGEAGINLNGVGTPYFVTTTDSSGNLVYTMITQTQNGNGYAHHFQPCNGANCTKGVSSRLTWVELR